MTGNLGSEQLGGCFPTCGVVPGRVTRWQGQRKITFGMLVVIVALGVIDVVPPTAQGGEASWKDLIPKPVPDAENAAPLYLQAAGLIKAVDEALATATPPGGEPRVERYDTSDWHNPARMAVVAKYVAEDADVMALVKEAAARPQCWFSLDWSDPPTMKVPHLAKMRNLARFVGCSAVVAGMQGKQAEALDDLRVGFVMSRHVCPEPTLIDQLVCYGMDSGMEQAAERVIGHGSMPEDQALALAEELGRIDYPAAFDRAMKMERHFPGEGFDQPKIAAKKGQAMARRALVEAALGVELYKQQTGRYPAELTDVSQTVAWKIAEDPFSGSDLVYKVVGPTYLLYSIGQDGQDDGGKPMRDQLQSWGLPAEQPGPGAEEDGDIVWMGTWEGVERARGR